MLKIREQPLEKRRHPWRENVSQFACIPDCTFKSEYAWVILMFKVVVGAICLGWYIAIIFVSTVGYVQIFRYYRKTKPRAVSEQLPSHDVPHITIIRPIKGLEPELYKCLAATFRQTYPKDKLTVYFCLSDRHEPALPIVERLLEHFPEFDAHIYIEDEDPILQAGGAGLGPNPKIRNMSRAYREAKGELIWIIDCNVWISRGVAGHMVDTLCGLDSSGRGKKFKFVHQLPLVVDVTDDQARLLESDQMHAASTSTTATDANSSHDLVHASTLQRIVRLGGGRLEELFLASSHAKFYTAINTVLIAPCIVGKSNMFRRAHLDALTSAESNGQIKGIDFFSHNICEDHLIGDLLWRRDVPEDCGDGAEKLSKHAMVFGDMAVQPMAGMSTSEYIARRVRWLRVRKFTVTLATFVEPGTESFLCSLYGAFAVTTVPWFHNSLGLPPIWLTFAAFWLASVSIWATVDWTLYQILHSMATIEVDDNTPAFARHKTGRNKRTFLEWLMAWLGREALALPIWTWAVYGGTSVRWRGQGFRVGMDMRVHALDATPRNLSAPPVRGTDRSSGRSTPRKTRRE